MVRKAFVCNLCSGLSTKGQCLLWLHVQVHRHDRAFFGFVCNCYRCLRPHLGSILFRGTLDICSTLLLLWILAAWSSPASFKFAQSVRCMSLNCLTYREELHTSMGSSKNPQCRTQQAMGTRSITHHHHLACANKKDHKARSLVRFHGGMAQR